MNKRLLLLRNISFLSTLAGLSACSSAPTVSVIGAFFPAWLICVGIGCFSAIGLRILFLKTGLDEITSDRLEIYLSLGTIIGLISWMVFFGW